MSLPAFPSDLTQTQKAAVIVHLLLREEVDPGIAKLPPGLQRRLVRTLGDLGPIDRDTLAAVAAEFAGQLDGGAVRFPKGLRAALASVGSHISPDVVSGLAAELPEGPGADVADGSWDTLAAMEADAILALMAREAPEVAAILMSKLSPVRSADILSRMEPERAATVALAFATTAEVGPETVARIGLTLGGASAGAAPRAFTDDPAARVGSILNAARSGDRNAVLEGLDAASPEFAARVRASVFSWDNIPERLDARDVPRVLREVEGDAVLAALGAEVEGPVAAFILGAISKRLGDQMREEIEEKGPPKPDDAEAARQAVAAAIRDMEERGDLVLNAPGGEELAEPD